MTQDRDIEIPSPDSSIDPLEEEMKKAYGQKYDRLAKVPDEVEKEKFIQDEIDETWNIADIIHSSEQKKFTDPLTGLLNREGMRLAVKRAYRDAEQFPGTEVYAFMIDLDHFRNINNQHGHQVGDQALIALAEVLKQNMRSSTDAAIRYGGEEFLLITSSRGPTFENQHAQAMDPNVFINKLRVKITQNVASKTAIKEQGVSAGYVKLEVDPVTHKPVTTPDELVRRADVALYSAKTHGRGRAHEYQPGMTMPSNK